MCQTCVENPLEFRAFLREHYAQEYAKDDLVRDREDHHNYVQSVEYLVEYPDDHDYTMEELARFKELADALDAATDPVTIARLVEELVTAMAERTSHDIDELMSFDSDPLAQPTKESIVDDQQAYAAGEDIAKQLIRAIQHLYHYHETRPQYLNAVVGQEFIDTINHRMSLYARGAMHGLPEFDTTFLVLNDEKATQTLSMIMTGVYLEALIAGFYAGSQGSNCVLWHTHELGPVGRTDERPPEVKIPEALAKILEHLETPEKGE